MLFQRFIWMLLRKKLDHLVKIGVLSSQGTSKWASPTFIIPKNDGRVHWVSNLRVLKKVIIRRQYLLPIIKEILKRHAGYSIFSRLTCQCKVTCLNWMMHLKICALLSHLMVYINITDCQLALHVPGIFPKNI